MKMYFFLKKVVFDRARKKVGRGDDVFYEGTSKARVPIYIMRHPDSFGWGKVTFYNEQPARKRINLALHAPVANVLSTRIWSVESFFATLTI